MAQDGWTVSDQDVEFIKQWLVKEQHLPKTFDDLMIKKFLFSCDSSLERTKKCINEFCTQRATLPEIFTNRDPMAKEIQRYYSITNVVSYVSKENIELLIYLLKEVPDDFDQYLSMKAFTTQLDLWLSLKPDVLPKNHIVIYDVKHYTLKLMTKIKILYFKAFINFLMEGMPIRLKNVHIINCPPFYEHLYTFVKPALPEAVRNLMYFHTDYTGLYEYMDKEALPVEYGGNGESMEEQNAEHVRSIIEQRKFYLDDNYWNADVNLLPTNDQSDDSMKGSFKMLEID